MVVLRLPPHPEARRCLHVLVLVLVLMFEGSLLDGLRDDVHVETPIVTSSLPFPASLAYSQ